MEVNRSSRTSTSTSSSSRAFAPQSQAITEAGTFGSTSGRAASPWTSAPIPFLFGAVLYGVLTGRRVALRLLPAVRPHAVALDGSLSPLSIRETTTELDEARDHGFVPMTEPVSLLIGTSGASSPVSESFPTPARRQPKKSGRMPI